MQLPLHKPNIVFVFADQLRADALGCMGNDQVITPNIDRLASDGLLTTNGISCQPVCTPARAQLMTGRYSHSTGVIHNDIRLPDSELVVSEVMKKHGYRTAYIGKWHLSGNRDNPVDARNRRGWDFWAVNNCSHLHFTSEYWMNDSLIPIRNPGHWEPDIQTDIAIEYIKNNHQSPFCLFLSFGPPHNPYKAPEYYLKMYRSKILKPRPNVPFSISKYLLPYYAMITSLDVCIGKISKALCEFDIHEDTIFIFTSDHGVMMGSQGHVRKQRPWEESINIPFILRYPRKVAPGQQRNWIVTTIDILPTILGFSGIPVPTHVHGVDYSSTFQGISTRERDEAFLFNVDYGYGPGTDWRGIRTKEWVYAYHCMGDWILYNLRTDPYQLRNLSDQPEFSSIKNELRTRLETIRTRIGENIRLKGKMPAPIILPKSISNKDFSYV